MEHRAPHPSVDRIARSLVEWAGAGTLIIDHMSRSAAAGLATSETSFPDVLTDLVRMTLAPLAGRHPEADLETAAAVVADAIETLGQELLLVEPGAFEPPNRAARRRARRGRCE